MLPVPGKPTPVARCTSCGWDHYVSVGFGSLGWHVIPVRCTPKHCRKHYLVVIHVSVQTGGLNVRVAGTRRIRLPGEDGVRRALLEEPIAGMTSSDVDTICTVAGLLARGGSPVA